MKNWHILYDSEKIGKLSVENIVEILLTNRSISSDEKAEFVNPDISKVNIASVGIEKKSFDLFEERIKRAIKDNEKIIIFGDYDVDGICASAILWETLFSKTKNVMPYIPDRIEEGYGLSIKGIDNVLKLHSDVKVIITVDNGIVAHDAVSYAKEKGIDVVVTDHHVKGEKEPDAYCILHTTSLCGAGIAWTIAKELQFEDKESVEEKLELAALATIADLVPLTGANRAIVKKGLEILKKSKRPGLLKLYKEAAIEISSIGVYTIGYVIAPRLNATGRIESAMNALRLLCTRDKKKASELARLLSTINKSRQDLTEESVEHAKLLAIESSLEKITLVAHETYNQGVIGLIASQLVEAYYKPAFAISIGDKISKGSARSIAGVNIIELLRSVGDTLLEAGGHPMAAGFSIETERIEEFVLALSKKAEEVVTDEHLKRFLKIDMLLSFESVTQELVESLKKLEPFGMANPEPVFATKNVTVVESRKIGREQNHLKMKLEKDGKVFDAIGFRMAEKTDFLAGDTIAIAYTLEENVWNGKTNLQLKLKDIHSN